MIAVLIAHLKNACPDYTEIEPALELVAAIDETTTLPVMYLFPGDESASGNESDTKVSQRVAYKVHVQIACAHAELETRKGELRAATVGWNPGQAEGYDDMQLDSGKLIDLKGGIAWWEDIYTTWRLQRSAF